MERERVSWKRRYLFAVLVEPFEASGKECGAFFGTGGVAFVLRKVFLERLGLDLLRELGEFVEEEDDGGFDEPLRVADCLEELEGLHH